MSGSVEVVIHQQTWDSEVSPLFVLQEPKLFDPAQAIEIHAVTTAVSPHEWGAVTDSCSLRKGVAGGQDPQVLASVVEKASVLTLKDADSGPGSVPPSEAS